MNQSTKKPHRSQAISRRGLFEALMRPFDSVNGELESISGESQAIDQSESTEAIIQGRFCLAYQGTTCFTCSERCPEPGAITLDKGIPTVHADLCTGCGICHDLCPAPRNAILMLAKPEAH